MRSAIVQYYQRAAELQLRNPWYREQVERYLLGNLRSDAATDRTTKKIISRRQRCRARLRAKQAGILAGAEEVNWLLRHENIAVRLTLRDGNPVSSGRVVMELAGSARHILAVERTIVNTVQRLSGIATATHSLVVRLPKNVVLAATRKTIWGALDKRAVAWGGGYTHRLGLFDGVMVKDNHLALVDHERLRRARWGNQLLTLEITSLAELKRAVIHYPQFTILLLDNFSPERIRQALRWLEQERLRRRYIIEASGGIDPATITRYAKSGLDVVSLGYLTHSAPALDFALDIIP